MMGAQISSSSNERFIVDIIPALYCILKSEAFNQKDQEKHLAAFERTVSSEIAGNNNDDFRKWTCFIKFKKFKNIASLRLSFTMCMGRNIVEWNIFLEFQHPVLCAVEINVTDERSLLGNAEGGAKRHSKHSPESGLNLEGVDGADKGRLEVRLC